MLVWDVTGQAVPQPGCRAAAAFACFCAAGAVGVEEHLPTMTQGPNGGRWLCLCCASHSASQPWPRHSGTDDF